MFPPQRPPNSLARLVFELSKLPGIGEKTALRLAHFILKQDASYAKSLAQALIEAKENTFWCQRCFHLTSTPVCSICTDPKRQAQVICVAEKVSDVLALEQAQIFSGHYHVLHGNLSPLEGIGPEDLKIQALLERVRELLTNFAASEVEIILATNPSLEGEATASYLVRQLGPFGVRVSQLAYGIPMGGLLEYTDRRTLEQALTHRHERSRS